jgi:hypothetical protein
MTTAVPQPMSPFGFCAPCLPGSRFERAVTLVDGTALCRAHALEVLAAVTSSGPGQPQRGR